MTPDQKMFILHFVKQLHSCIEKHGAGAGAANAAGLSVCDRQGSYSCRKQTNNERQARVQKKAVANVKA